MKQLRLLLWVVIACWISAQKAFAEESNLLAGAIPSSWTTKPSPTDLGWYIAQKGAVGTWNTGSRFELTTSTTGLKQSDGTTTYNGSFFYIRWDASGAKYDYYVYPVKLEANTTYELTGDVFYWSNYNSANGGNITSKAVQFGVTQDSLVSVSPTTTSLVSCSVTKQLYPGKLEFTTTTAGTYYLTFTGGWGLFGLANLSLVKSAVQRYIYLSGSQSFSDAGETSIGGFTDATVTVSGQTGLHLLQPTPISNSTIDLSGSNAWLYLDRIKPSKVISNYLNSITVNGSPIIYNSSNMSQNNVRLAVYDNGTVIIPDGESVKNAALTVYDGENFTGNSRTFGINTFNDLGEWDNKIRSFKLHHGFMATLANNADGTGFSRCFVANDGDIEMATLPEGMEKFVSFVKVFKWEWVSKKGKAGAIGSGDDNLLNCTVFYDWSAGGKSDDPDFEYTPIRQNLGWPGFNEIYGKKNVSHLLAFNEPDDNNQANCTTDAAIAQWPELLKSGLRLGSPASKNAAYSGWPSRFFATLDSLNYRCDFVAGHFYNGGLSPSNLVNQVRLASSKGNGRPVWMTEWNNGANWTTESWPDATGPQRDADFNIMFDANGDTIFVSRPLSPANAEKQRAWIAELLPALDNLPICERYFEYDWVQDARKLIMGNKLTPAGKVYAAHQAGLAYNKASEYVHTWKIAPPFPYLNTNAVLDSIKLSWYDHNGETGKKYILERKMDSETEFTLYRELIPETDYQYGGIVTFVEAIPCISTVTYRIKALSYKDTESLYSREKSFTRAAEATAPTLKAEALSTQVVRLSWNKVDNASYYNVERSTSIDGTYTALKTNLTDTMFVDTALTENTTYYYRVYSKNTAATTNYATINVTTLQLTAPVAMSMARVASGDGQTTLSWGFAYDAIYRIYRSTSANGSYQVIAEGVSDTRYEDKGLANGVTYYYKMEPYNNAGTGPQTDVMPATPMKGQHLHIAFDEATGTVTHDEWGGYDATFNNSPTWTDGRNATAAVAVARTNSAYLNLGSGVVSSIREFTLATWVKFSGSMVRLFDFGTNTANFMMCRPSTTNMRYKLTCAKGTLDQTFSCTIAKDTWVHIAITQTADSLMMYVNGQRIGSAANTAGVYPCDMGVTGNNFLGRSMWASDAYSDNTYDDFRIYDVALSDDNVKSLYEEQDFIIPDTSYTRYVKANSWNTICLPQTATVPESISAYEVAGISADKKSIIASPVSRMEAGVPYLFYAPTEVAATFQLDSLSMVPQPLAGTNGLIGMFRSSVGMVPNGSFILHSNQWYRVDNADVFNLGNNRAYLEGLDRLPILSNIPSNAKKINFQDVATGLGNVETSNADYAPIYTVGGVKLQKAQRGIIIKNGNKYVKK